MKSDTGENLFAKIKGRYSPNMREVISAVSVVLIQASAILWLGFENEGFSLSPAEIALSVVIIVFGCGYILREELRTVVVDDHQITSTGPFGSFRQRIETEEIKKISFSGFSRGIKVDVAVNGKDVRLITNRRFHEKIRETLGS